MDLTRPDEVVDGHPHVYAPAANLVVDIAYVESGGVLRVDDCPDEHLIILATTSCPLSVSAGGRTVEVESRSLVVVPPGSSTVRALAGGYVYRVFSNRTTLHAAVRDKLPTRSATPEVAPLTPWPEPVGGYQLRVYRLADYDHLTDRKRVFRTTNMMVNMGAPRDEPRPVSLLSPHSHADFEQCSLITQGDYVHHIRRPWSKDAAQWLPDDHVRIGSPSVTVIHAGDVHTSQNVAPGPWELVDIFAPPRWDFTRAGHVLNAADYPAPPDEA